MLALFDGVIVQTQPLTDIETQLAAVGTPVVHFLDVAPIVFLVSVAALTLVSVATPAPDIARIRDLTWSSRMFTGEQLNYVPAYKDYRYLSLALLIVTLVFVANWW
jgi:hypothetical protein